MRAKIWLMLALMGVTFSTRAQEVLVLCEGAQDFISGEVLELPRLGKMDLGEDNPVLETLFVFEGQAFATDLILDETGENAYVAGEDVVYRLDASTGEWLAEQAVEGARQLFLAGDRLFVTRGDFDPETMGSVPFDAYLVALDRDDLSWQGLWSADGVSGPSFASESMCVVGEVLHVGINNAFAWGEEVGMIGRLNLSTGEYAETDLGNEGLNPVHMFPAGDGVVVVNARQYESTSLSRVDALGQAMTVPVAETTAGCGAAAVMGDEVMYQVHGESGFRVANGWTLAEVGTWAGNGLSAYSMAILEDGRRLLGTTDFTTSGQVNVLSEEGDVMATIVTGIAPSRLVALPVSSGMDDWSHVRPASTRLVSETDVLGRPVGDQARGLRILRFSDGAVRKVMR